MDKIRIICINKDGKELEETLNIPKDEKFSIRDFKKDYMSKFGAVPDGNDKVVLIEIDGENQTDLLLKRRHKTDLCFDDIIKYLKSQMDCNKKSREKYAKNHKSESKSIPIRFMIKTESDLLEYLDSIPNKAGYIKSLIRADMENQKNT